MCGCGQERLWGAGEAVGEDRWFSYDVVAEDPRRMRARACSTRRTATFQTPIFMPVGTQADGQGHPVPRPLSDLGTKILLNEHATISRYASRRRPCGARWAALHRFMHWHGPILTDSGGFQVFSPRGRPSSSSDDGVQASSRRRLRRSAVQDWTPEAQHGHRPEARQRTSCMQLDQCVGYPADAAPTSPALTELSSRVGRPLLRGAHPSPTRRSSASCRAACTSTCACGASSGSRTCRRFPRLRHRRLLGGRGPRHRCSRRLEPLCVRVYAARAKPRYLMGVGNPTTLVRGVAAGIDMFDCVLPTRTARTGTAFSNEGRINLKNARFREDRPPARRVLRLPRLLGRLLARLHSSPGEAKRNARVHPHLRAQHLLPARPYATRPRGHHRRHLRRLRLFVDGLSGGERLVETRLLSE